MDHLTNKITKPETVRPVDNSSESPINPLADLSTVNRVNPNTVAPTQTSIVSPLSAALASSSNPVSQDTEVTERVDTVVAAAERGGDSSYFITEAIADESLSAEQKEEFVAQVIELAGGSDTGSGSLSEVGQRSLRSALEDIGTGSTPFAEEHGGAEAIQDSVQDAIKDGVRSGRLDADDIYNVVSPDINTHSAGTRELLSTIGDPALYDEVSTKLLSDAKREGYDLFDSEGGAFILRDAADFANMAANLSNRGMYYSGAARAIVDEIARVDALGPVSDGKSLTETLLFTDASLGSENAPAEREAFAILSETVNSVGYVTGDRQVATDSLYADLVRSADDGIAGGLDLHGDHTEAVNELGKYLTDNVGRLAETDWRKDNTEHSSSDQGFYNELLTDSIENVVLHEDFTRHEFFAEAIADEIVDLAAVAGDPNADQTTQENAGNTLGTIAGSINQAADNHVKQAGDDSQGLRVLTDLLTNKVISAASKKAGLGGLAVSEGGKALVNEIWDRVRGAAESRASGEVDGALGDLRTLLADVREVLGESGDSTFVNQYDDREDFYHDD